jgi:hypothetical protein
MGLFAPSGILNRKGFLVPPSSAVAPFDPNSITGLALWLKADAGVTLNGSGQVTQWVDQSPSSLSFVPDYASADVIRTDNYINGLPAIVFGGTEGGVIGLYNTSVFVTKSVFIVLAATGGPAEYSVPYENDGLNIYSTSSYYGQPWGSYLNANTNALTNLAYDGTPYILSARSTDGTDQTFYLNNVDDTDYAGEGFYNERSEIVIGNGGARSFFPQPFEGAIMEIIAYTSYLSATDMTNVYNYLNGRYAIV